MGSFVITYAPLSGCLRDAEKRTHFIGSESSLDTQVLDTGEHCYVFEDSKMLKGLTDFRTIFRKVPKSKINHLEPSIVFQ